MFARTPDGFAQPIETSLVSFVIAVGKVEARDAETRVNEFFQLVDGPTGGAQRADNLGLARGHVRLAQDGFQRNVASTEFRSQLTHVGLTERHDAAGAWW